MWAAVLPISTPLGRVRLAALVVRRRLRAAILTVMMTMIDEDCSSWNSVVARLRMRDRRVYQRLLTKARAQPRNPSHDPRTHLTTPSLHRNPGPSRNP